MSDNIIAVRREDKNPWEKRAPLIPAHVRELIHEHNATILVQASKTRVFQDQEYEQEGASVLDDIAEAKIILAIKEVPLDLIVKERVYLFFSHTTKGQEYNLPMLRKLKESGCTLIDYEKVCDAKGARLLFFGIQAGQAGMIETLSALGKRWHHLGFENPFLALDQPFHYASLVEAKEVIQKIGWEIHDHGLNPELAPLVCGFKGYGRTSQGAQEIFDLLPFENIEPQELQSFYEEKNHSAHRVYKVVFKEEHMVKPINTDSVFDLQDYYRHPERYQSVFHSYLPFLSVLVNCIYWEERYPRFVPLESLQYLFSQYQDPRLKVIGDITCDINGSIQCTRYATTPEKPTFVYDPKTDEVLDGITGRGIVVMSIDNLPAEIPLESSVFFSSILKDFVPAIVQADYSGDFENCILPDPIKKAVILYRGEFTPSYSYMQEFLK